MGLCVAVLLSGCAARRPRAAIDGGVPLESFIEKVRELSLTVRPAKKDGPPTLEGTDPVLSAARLALTVAPTSDNFRRVAEAYARLGVLDAAYDHFAAAIRLSPRDARSYDGLARVWRDWGFSHLGLTDAYRAIYYAPDSPAPRNTLGTLLVNLRQPAAARVAFERVLALDPGAPYALNNLCYATLLEGNATRAVERCRTAVDADPKAATPRNNLGLAYVAAGDVAAASREFERLGDPAVERFNLGVALLATGHFDEAATAFDAVTELRPWLKIARARARQSRALSAAQKTDYR